MHLLKILAFSSSNVCDPCKLISSIRSISPHPNSIFLLSHHPPAAARKAPWLPPPSRVRHPRSSMDAATLPFSDAATRGSLADAALLGPDAVRHGPWPPLRPHAATFSLPCYAPPPSVAATVAPPWVAVPISPLPCAGPPLPRTGPMSLTPPCVAPPLPHAESMDLSCTAAARSYRRRTRAHRRRRALPFNISITLFNISIPMFQHLFPSV